MNSLSGIYKKLYDRGLYSDEDYIPDEENVALKFQENGYLLIPKLITDIQNLYSPPPFDDDGNRKFGTLGYREGQVVYKEEDGQVPTAFSRYGYPPFENIHDLVRQALENTLGFELFPTYYFERFYWKDSVLKKHVDRPACEISVTIQISSNTKPWPIFFKKPNGETTCLILGDGDGVVYKGMELEHWRDNLDSRFNKIQRYINKLRKKDDDTYHHQIFFHYVKAQGNYVQHAFDR